VSRIGKQPVLIPEGVTVTIDNNTVKIEGKLGTLTYETRPEVKIEEKEGQIVLSVDSVANSNYWGLTRSLINNMIVGVTKGYSRTLEVIGTGYRISEQKGYLIFFVGHSHNIWYEIPEGIKTEIKGSKLTLTGIDKQKVNQSAAVIRSFRKPEPYKGKGIKYSDEIIRRKAGKTAG